MKSLVVVESPAKAKTINKYLGKDYIVLASFGHIRQLPKENGSVEPDNNFHIKYEVDKASQKHVKALVDAMKECNKLILASDPDREGEAIAWHVVEVLKQKKAIKKDTVIERVVFNAITKATLACCAFTRSTSICLASFIAFSITEFLSSSLIIFIVALNLPLT